MPGWLQLDGRILPDGSADISARGLVGKERAAIGGAPAGHAIQLSYRRAVLGKLRHWSSGQRPDLYGFLQQKKSVRPRRRECSQRGLARARMCHMQRRSSRGLRQDVATDKVRKASRSRASDSPSPGEDTDIRTAQADVEYKFQGQEAPIVIYSLTTSTHADVTQAFESSFYQLLRRFSEHVAAIKEEDSCAGQGKPPASVFRALSPKLTHTEYLQRTIESNEKTIEALLDGRITGMGYGPGLSDPRR